MAIIFLPGIKGSELVDSYPLDWPRRWSLEDMTIGDIIESSLDFALVDGRYDAADGHWMRPTRLIHYAYGAIISKLRAWQQPEPVYTFSYDWRKPLELSAARLVQAMDELAGREKAVGRSPELKFVTHSMGGLVLRSALALRKRRDPFDGIGRCVFIAPPFRGAIGAPYALVVGERDGWFGTDEDYRRISRTFPSVYQMTPSWDRAAVDEDGHGLDLFDAGNWQANVRDRTGFQSRFLCDAEAFVRGRRARHGGQSPAPMLDDKAMAGAADRVLVLCGTGQPTLRSLPVLTRNAPNPNWFDFAHAQGDTHGDGRVHLLGAAVNGVTLACFDHAGEHALLCRNERVANLTSRWLEGHQALRMTRRTPDDPSDRRSRRYFRPWDGDPESFSRHIA